MNRSFFTGAAFGFVAGIIIVGYAKADAHPSPSDTLAQVNKILGTNVETVPTVELVDHIPGGLWGAYLNRTQPLFISEEAPDACRPIITAHELAHYVDDVANLPGDSESIARKVEENFEPWSPGCYGKHKYAAPSFPALADESLSNLTGPSND